MIEAKHVQEVARTGAPLVHNGGTITAEQVVKLTTAADWDGTLFSLRWEAASQIAAQFNAAHPDPSDPTPPVEGSRRLALVAA